MGSSRLPGKIFLDLDGEPMLVRVARRLSRATSLDVVWIATTTAKGDDPVAALCSDRGWECFRGSETDVLERYRYAAYEAEAGVVVRVTSDCPLIDPDIVDSVVRALEADEKVTYSSNTVPSRTFPRGLDVEAMDTAVLDIAWREATSPLDREHVTPYLWRQPERFPQACVTAEQDFSHHRWTVDTREDYDLVRRIYEHFEGDSFGWYEVLMVLNEHPDWYRINAHVQQKEL